MAVLGLLFNVIYGVIIAKVILSFVMPMVGQRAHPMLVNFNLLINRITEPIFAPIRRYTTFSGLDFSPFVIILVLAVIRSKLGV